MRHRALFFRSHTTQKELCYATASFLISFTHARALAPAKTTTTTTINILVQTHLPTINNINVSFFSSRRLRGAHHRRSNRLEERADGAHGAWKVSHNKVPDCADGTKDNRSGEQIFLTHHLLHLVVRIHRV